MTVAKPGSAEYFRRLGVFDTTMIVIGGIIGAGIFLNPAIVAQRVPRAMTIGMFVVVAVYVLAGLFFRFAARLHPVYRTPTGGILIQAVWAIALVLSGTYGQLLDYVVFGDWIFFGLIVATIFGYRRRDAFVAPGSPSTYRAPGYPLLPALFVITAAFVVASAIWSNPRNAMLGVLLIAAGIPAYLFGRRRNLLPAGQSAP